MLLAWAEVDTQGCRALVRCARNLLTGTGSNEPFLPPNMGVVH